jgi:type I restriction enzyme, S subunit
VGNWGAGMSEWPKFRIDEIAAKTAIGPFGSRMKSDTYTPFGVPVIRGTNITGGRSFSGDWVYVSEKDADQLANCNVREGDLVFPHRGAIGEVGIVPGDRDRYLLSSSLMSLKCDETKADSLYLYYFFKSHEGRHQLLKNASQVGTPGIGQPLTSLRSIELHLPPVEQQKGIAKALDCLDNKIELNRRMNETLEAMARAIFQSWFVDFDPVRAKASGERVDAICHSLGLTPELLALFPDNFEDSERGEIPRGWSISTIGSLASVTGGSTPNTKEPKYWEGGVHHWATPKDLSRLSSPVLLGTERKVSEEGLAQIGSGLLEPGAVLLSSRAPIGYRAINEVPVAVNQGFIAMKPSPGVSKYFLLYWAEWAHHEIVSRANGSTFLEISKTNFRPIPVVRPTDELFTKFDQYVQPIYKRIVSNEQETQMLTEQRDTLLPELLAGKILLDTEERIF